MWVNCGHCFFLLEGKPPSWGYEKLFVGTFLLDFLVVNGRRSSDKYCLWLRTLIALEKWAISEDDECDR